MISILQVRFQSISKVRLWRKKAKSYHQSAIKMSLNKKKMADSRHDKCQYDKVTISGVLLLLLLDESQLITSYVALNQIADCRLQLLRL